MAKSIITYWTHWQRRLALGGSAWPPGQGPAAWSPNADMYDGPDGLVIKVEVAGVQAKDIQVDLDRESITVQGVRRDPYCGETAVGYRFRQMEVEYGPFRRTLALPHPVDARRARAHLAHGVLEIHLPRARVTRARSITIVMEP